MSTTELFHHSHCVGPLCFVFNILRTEPIFKGDVETNLQLCSLGNVTNLAAALRINS